MDKYPFKRNFYYSAEDAINNNRVVIISGARKVGKTIALLQLEDCFTNAEYTDMKRCSDDSERVSKVNKIIKDIEDNKNVIHLIDEATYMLHPDASVESIAFALTENPDSKTKVVISGSQSKAINAWGHRSFASNAKYIEADFLSYPEWLAFKGFTKPSIETYSQFVCNTREFYKDFTSAKEYLQSCLDETVISNSKAVENIYNNKCDLLNVDKLLDVLYASLVTLHNSVNYNTFQKETYFKNEIRRLFADEYNAVGEKLVNERIEDFLSERYKNFRSMNAEEIHQALQFLTNCGLITVTYISPTFDVHPYIIKDYLEGAKSDYTKTALFEKINVCIKYPMFYMEMLKDVLGDNMPEKINGNLLGSITECYIRGILPTVGCYEYHDTAEREIDYVNNSKGVAIEITISDKSIKDTHFDLLPEGYKKILLTKTKEYLPTKKNLNIEMIPYYKFIFDNSEGSELVKKRTGIPSGGATGTIITPSMYSKGNTASIGKE